MGTHSGTRAGLSGGGGGITKSQLNADLQTQRSLLMPDLTNGTPKEIADARDVQKKLSKALYYYAIERDSDGKKVSQNVADSLTKGSTADIQKYMNDYADRMSFGNDSLIPQKLSQIKATQKDLAERQNRVIEVLNSSNFTNAKWLLSPQVRFKNAGKVDFRNYLTDIAKSYVDGKSSEYFKKSGYEDLTDKFFKK